MHLTEWDYLMPGDSNHVVGATPPSLAFARMHHEAIGTHILGLVRPSRPVCAEMNRAERCQRNIGVQLAKLGELGGDVLFQLGRTPIVHQLPVEAGLRRVLDGRIRRTVDRPSLSACLGVQHGPGAFGCL